MGVRFQTITTVPLGHTCWCVTQNQHYSGDGHFDDIVLKWNTMFALCCCDAQYLFIMGLFQYKAAVLPVWYPNFLDKIVIR